LKKGVWKGVDESLYKRQACFLLAGRWLAGRWLVEGWWWQYPADSLLTHPTVHHLKVKELSDLFPAAKACALKQPAGARCWQVKLSDLFRSTF